MVLGMFSLNKLFSLFACEITVMLCFCLVAQFVDAYFDIFKVGSLKNPSSTLPVIWFDYQHS